MAPRRPGSVPLSLDAPGLPGINKEVVQLLSLAQPGHARTGGAQAAGPSSSNKSRLGGRFWQLWWATAVSSTGDGLVGMVALPLLALTMTKSPLVIAGVTATYRVAAAVASLPAGLLTDRWDRRSLMVACNLMPGVVLAGLVVAMTLGAADLAMVYASAIVISACDVTYTLALQAIFPDLVSSNDQLAVANGRLMAVEGTGEQLVGPAAGGFLFGLARRAPFLADSVSFIACAVFLRSLPSAPSQVHALAGPGPGAATTNGAGPGGGPPALHRKQKPSWWQDLRTGFSMFNAKPPLKVLAAAMSAISFSQSMVLALLVIYCEHSLHLSPTGYGAFLAGASVLGLAGLYFGGAAQARMGAAGMVIAGVLACGLSYLGMSVANLAVLGALAFGLQELGTTIANVGSVTTRQQLIPREMYGRVGAVHRLFVVTSGPFGALAGGLIADAFGVRPAMLVAGAADVAVLVFLAPALRRHLPRRAPRSREPVAQAG